MPTAIAYWIAAVVALGDPAPDGSGASTGGAPAHLRQAGARGGSWWSARCVAVGLTTVAPTYLLVVISVLLASSVGAAIYIGAVIGLRVPGATQALDVVRRRLPGRRRGDP